MLVFSKSVKVGPDEKEAFQWGVTGGEVAAGVTVLEPVESVHPAVLEFCSCLVVNVLG